MAKPKGIRSNPDPLFHDGIAGAMGLERARGADEQEEEGDAREPVSPEPCRRGRSPGRAEAKVVESPLRHHVNLQRESGHMPGSLFS